MFFSFFTRRKKPGRPSLSIPDFPTSSTSAFQIVDHIGNAIAQGISPGLPASEIQTAIDGFLADHRLKGSFRGFKNYPYSVSVSLNHEVLRGDPSDRILKNGDLATIETGLEKDGQFAYFGWTVPVGNISDARRRLLEASQRALDEGCQAVALQGGTLPITRAIDASLRNLGFKPNRDFVGYRIGNLPQMPPMIPCALLPNSGGSPIHAGMSLAIIVIAHSGEPACFVQQNGRTIVSRDGSDSALLSKTVTLTQDGVLSRSHPVFQYR